MEHNIYEIYESILRAVFCALLTVAAWKDGKERRIPDRLTAALAGFGIWRLLWKAGLWITGIWPNGGLLSGAVGGTARGAAGLAEHVFGSLGGAVFGAGIFLVILLIRPGAFGGGDVKLLAAGGIFLELERTITAFGMSILLAGVVEGICLAAGKGNTVGRKGEEERQTAFGPFLSAGMMLSCFWGEMLWKWYVG